MISAMILAHLVGDYVLQWDSLAAWKSRSLGGVLAHSGVVFLVTWLFSLPFDPSWWPGVVFIGVAHFIIDALPLYVSLPGPPLARFALDQAAHALVIGVALIGGGYLSLTQASAALVETLQGDQILLYLLGYAFITMPVWVIAKFMAYGLVRGTGPNFPEGTNKYVGILERVLITTFVLLGQFLLVPVAAAPRLVLEWPRVTGDERAPVFMVEFLCSVTMAVGTGLLLSLL